MLNIQDMPDDLRSVGLQSLAPVPFLDRLLVNHGASKDRPPASYAGPWIDHLAWGVDSAVAAIRLALAGQLAGATMVARLQLERWTNHRAFNAKIAHRSGESSFDYFARVWSLDTQAQTSHTTDLEADPSGDIFGGHAITDALTRSVGEPDDPHRHVRLSDGEEICAALTLGLLDDLLHGFDGVDAVEWDSRERCDPGKVPANAYVAIGAIASAVTLSLRQIREALSLLAIERQDMKAVMILRQFPDHFSKADSDSGTEVAGRAPIPKQAKSPPIPFPVQLSTPDLASLLPLHPMHGLRTNPLGATERAAELFDQVLDGQKPFGRYFRDDELLRFAFAWHRRASARSALLAFDQEREHLGDDFNLDSLGGREMWYVLVSEAAGVAAGWLSGPEADAGALIASGLRSAYWLWLEDDDRAMAVLRCVLEQCARMRAWRTKPEKAAQLEESTRTTPRDWLGAASWRRLEPLNRALGELAHSRITSSWHGARELLATFQRDGDSEESFFTARGHCLDVVTKLACQEVLATSRQVSNAVGDEFDALFQSIGIAGAEVDVERGALFDHIWSKRSIPLGPPTFGGPAVEWFRANRAGAGS
ncbi:hypothetical protein [Tenggerimyces flavus]|uniref:Uncharacterized protein n=1 Tax=Tenggerimyces flavus TaxID=1708749 RepID=A0ABV7YC75_9ACTN|nr:hypothetical protein [Tenggerimyces flavus]MBM7783676.1 hypothetical protein [Tenggerimyces flavus]